MFLNRKKILRFATSWWCPPTKKIPPECISIENAFSVYFGGRHHQKWQNLKFYQELFNKCKKSSINHKNFKELWSKIMSIKMYYFPTYKPK